MNRPLLTLSFLLAGTGLFFLETSMLFAGPGGSAYGESPLEGAADREIARRQENLVLAEAALKRGDDALAANDIANAYASYKEAVDMAPDGSADRALRSRALSRFSSTAVRYAEYLVSQGEYARAEATAREVLEPRYNPNYRPAAVFLTRLEQPDYFNKTVTPEFANQRNDVETLLQAANGYFDSGRYDLAAKKYQQVLGIDKYNAAALRGLEQVELGKQRYYDSAYNETRSRMLWQVDKAWERPKRRFVEATATDTGILEERRGTEAMVARLNRIILPNVDISDKTVRQAVDELKRLSRQYDNAADEPGRRGVNIVLKLPSGPAPDAAAAMGEAPGTAVAVPDTINIRLSNIPLYEALRYVATLANLKIKVEPFAVSLVPLTEPTDTLEDREFKVPPGFISGIASADSSVATPGPGETISTNPRLAGRQTARDFLEAQGVTFPPGASATYVPGNSRLVVRNTAANIETIERLVSAAMEEEPKQIEIESKFVEISQNNLKELGFDWALGPFSIGGSGVYGGGGETISGTGGYPFVNPATGLPVGGTSVTESLRSGSGVDGALTLNSIDSLLARNLGLTTGGPAPAVLGISGIFTNPQFQVVIRALNQKKGVDLMAGPKVTTKSGQEATISISRIFPYPETYEPPQIPENSGTANSGGGTAGETIPIVTPSFPTDFTTRNLGVTLRVTPNVGPDGYTIELDLKPEVVDFDGFINYGSPIYSANTPTAAATVAGVPIPGSSTVATLLGFVTGEPTRDLLTENVINQPIFSTRRVETSVSIWDGQTVALGGLIREDVQKISDKVPFLGDIPLAGVLFRSEVEQKIKKNLIIFVTARLMDAAGQPLRSLEDTDQEEVVEELGLPEDLKKPSISAKGFRQK